MPRRFAIGVVLAVCACVILTGCMPKMTVAELKAKMPERPAELDRLDAFVGKWHGQGQATMAMLEEPLESSGTSEFKWDDSRWFVVERGEFSMGGLGEMTGLSTWTYDTKGKVYRSTWTDSMGTVGLGTAKYEEEDGIWKMKATSHGPFGKSTAKGWIKFPDNDTMEWSWTEYSGLFKTMEMSGTSKRVR